MKTDREKQLIEEAFAGITRDSIGGHLGQLKNGRFIDVFNLSLTYEHTVKMIVIELPDGGYGGYKIINLYPDYEEDSDEFDPVFTFNSMSAGQIKHVLQSEYGLRTHASAIKHLDKYGFIKKEKLEELFKYREEEKEKELEKRRLQREKEEYERLKEKFGE